MSDGVGYAAGPNSDLSTQLRFKTAEIDLLRIFRDQILGSGYQEDDYRSYIASSDFHAGDTYRDLSPNDREQGAYFLIRNRGVLANELFSESQHRRSWSETTFQCYLAAKHVDRVIVERGYHRQFPTNEPRMLETLVARGAASVSYGAVGDRIVVYDVSPFRDSIPAPASLKACGI